ncbi:MAG: multiheme c-type cytochrome [Candidatus Eisenbacteria bacterium]|nr:multiheme c-type cytochrome [Candidatus Eisenbacteria bacterium]
MESARLKAVKRRIATKTLQLLKRMSCELPIPPTSQERSTRLRVQLAGLIVLSILLFPGSFLAPSPRQLSSDAPQYESAEQCRRCHLARYNEWKGSMHSKSAPKTNPLFAKLYERAVLDTKGETKKYCIRCHAPVADLNGDTELIQPLTSEGVNCDVCHTISEMSIEPAYWPYVRDPGPLKRGPSDARKPKGHKTTKSGLFTSSRICLGCHGAVSDFEGRAGCSCLAICDTRSEWLESPYPDQESDCKSCHMKKGAKGKQRLHYFEGTQKGDLLKTAATLRIKTSDSAGNLDIFVEVENSGTGHLLPTGPPTRMVYLKVEARDESGKTLWSNFKDNPLAEDRYSVFMLTLADSAGKVPALPWAARKIAMDTRLEPMKKTGLFYRIPRAGVNKVAATLFYRLAPLPLLNELGITDRYYLEPKIMTQASRELAVPLVPDRFSPHEPAFPGGRKDKE